MQRTDAVVGVLSTVELVDWARLAVVPLAFLPAALRRSLVLKALAESILHERRLAALRFALSVARADEGIAHHVRAAQRQS